MIKECFSGNHLGFNWVLLDWGDCVQHPVWAKMTSVLATWGNLPPACIILVYVSLLICQRAWNGITSENFSLRKHHAVLQSSLPGWAMDTNPVWLADEEKVSGSFITYVNLCPCICSVCMHMLYELKRCVGVVIFSLVWVQGNRCLIFLFVSSPHICKVIHFITQTRNPIFSCQVDINGICRNVRQGLAVSIKLHSTVCNHIIWFFLPFSLSKAIFCILFLSALISVWLNKVWKLFTGTFYESNMSEIAVQIQFIDERAELFDHERH